LKEGTLVEEEGEPKTPLQLAYEEGKDLESMDKIMLWVKQPSHY
jgi:hypothetical protein